MTLNPNEPILRELRKISKILLLANATSVEVELEKIANTPIRKKMWALVDGKRMSKDIAKEVNVSLMAVSRFLEAASIADLVEYTQREPPRKILDYVPPAWISLIISDDVSGIPPKAEERKNEKSSSKQTDILAISKQGEIKDEPRI